MNLKNEGLITSKIRQMKNTSKTIIFILLIFNTFVSFAQKLECKKIEFSFNPSVEKAEEAGLKVRVFLKVYDLENDTIILRTNVKMSLLGPKNIKACLINRDGSLLPLVSWVDNLNTVQSENIQLIKILMPNKRKANVLIAYNVFGSNMFKYEGNEDFCAYQQIREYYYPMNIPIREIKVSSPDSIEKFLYYKKWKKEIKDINIFFINNKKYVKNSEIKGSFNINMYIPDSLINDKRMKQKVVDIHRYIDRLSVYLSSFKDIDIIFINWRDDKTRRAFGEVVGNHAVCDINFNSKDLLHELLHVLLQTSVEEHSKGEYFVKESVIEWLALFFSNKISNTDVYNSTSFVSLYDAQINNHTTWDLIYTTGPSIIQQIASKCSEEKMAHVIISFIKKNKNKTINYNDFVIHVKKLLSDDLGNELDCLVKTSANRRIKARGSANFAISSNLSSCL